MATKSECCDATIYATFGDGVLIGWCERCDKSVCRVNRKTGRAEWLDGKSPWCSVDEELRAMPEPEKETAHGSPAR